MDNHAAIDFTPMDDYEPLGYAEYGRFEARSVTGASYTIVEQRHVDDDAAEEHARTRYCTAYARLPVVANDDGSFTIVPTHTRLVRVDHF